MVGINGRDAKRHLGVGLQLVGWMAATVHDLGVDHRRLDARRTTDMMQHLVKLLKTKGFPLAPLVFADAFCLWIG